MYSLIYPQDSKLFMDCQARNEDIDMSCCSIHYILCKQLINIKFKEI